MAERDGDGWIDCSCGAKHWGRYGAAGLLLIRRNQILLQHRAPWVHNGDTWGIPGGARDSHEDVLQAALREAHEETGLEIEGVRAQLTHLEDHGDWSYTTIIGTHDDEALEFHKNHETQDLRWFRFEEVAGLALHPSFAKSWPVINRLIVEIADEGA